MARPNCVGVSLAARGDSPSFARGDGRAEYGVAVAVERQRYAPPLDDTFHQPEIARCVFLLLEQGERYRASGIVDGQDQGETLGRGPQAICGGCRQSGPACLPGACAGAGSGGRDPAALGAH